MQLAFGNARLVLLESNLFSLEQASSPFLRTPLLRLPLPQLIEGFVALTVTESIKEAIATKSSTGNFHGGTLTTVIGGFAATIIAEGNVCRRRQESNTQSD
jgi:hypothetical protein